MATATLRVAQVMRSLSMKSSWNHTSRLMSTNIRSHSNTLSRGNLFMQHTKEANKAARSNAMISYQPIRFEATMAQEVEEVGDQRPTRTDIGRIDRIITMFEDRCQRNERVLERDFVKTFNLFTQVVDSVQANSKGGEDMSNIIQYTAMLLRCCGSLMFDTPPKGRELLAGNLWTYIKDRKIPLDISHFNCLIRVMNENETVYDPQKILGEIKQHNLNPDRVTYQRLIHQYCTQGDISGATKLLEVMKDADMELTEATFASLIIGYCKQEKPPAISEMFDLMRQNGVEPGAKSYTAALVAQAERFAKDPEGAIVELGKVIEMMEKDEIQLSSNEHIDLILHLGPLRDSQPIVTGFFNKYINRLYGSVTTRYRIMATALRANQIDMASDLFWTQTVNERALQSGNIGTYYLVALSKHFNVPSDFAVKEGLKLQEKGWNPKALQILYYHSAESGNLNLTRAAFKKFTEQEPFKVLYTWPLIAQAKNQDEVVKVLKEDLNPRLDTQELLETFSQWVWPKFADNVSKLFELNKELGYDNNMLFASYLNYSVQENKIAEAIKFISEMPQNLVDEPAHNQGLEAAEEDAEDGEPNFTPRLTRPSERNNLIARLLNQIAEQTKDPELVQKAFNMCQVPGQQISVRSLRALIRVHLLNNDFDKALEEFLRIAKEYRATPFSNELMSHCLINKNPENLQKIMNAVSDVYGEYNSLFDLAVCCLSCDKLKQAQKIFASPGFRVRPVRVYQTCRALARQENITMLENFVNLTRDMYDVNQEFLYQVLIDTYDRTSNANRALNLWNMMQEEEFQPSKRSLIMIADLLEKNNMSVPFQRPKTNSSERASSLDRRQRNESRNQV